MGEGRNKNKIRIYFAPKRQIQIALLTVSDSAQSGSY